MLPNMESILNGVNWDDINSLKPDVLLLPKILFLRFVAYMYIVLLQGQVVFLVMTYSSDIDALRQALNITT